MQELWYRRSLLYFVPDVVQAGEFFDAQTQEETGPPGLLEQAGILYGHSNLAGQSLQHCQVSFVKSGQMVTFHVQYADNLVFGLQGDGEFRLNLFQAR